MKSILGKKIGMTQIFTEDGAVVPVTVVEAGPMFVIQVKTVETDGYNAIQCGYVDKKEKITDNKKKGSLYNILYYKNKSYGSVNEVKKTLEIIEKSLTTYKKMLKNKTNDQVYSIYSDKFDNSIDIKKEAYKKVKEIIYLEREDYKIFVDDDYCRFVYGKVFLILQNEVNQNKIEYPKTNQLSNIYQANY